jgi:glycosyltransferase involved in cell wall biosynthesis|tara:strand:- start:69656 stop:71605 length:1950 start_codon:yes stop_codon:yes gene_type:complete
MNRLAATPHDVAVVIPCFNAAPYLAQAVGSVLEQTLPPSEIIIADNGSSDDSLKIACALRALSDKIAVVEVKEKGAPAARNTGFACTSSEHVMFMDADDVLGPNVLSELSSLLRIQPGIAIGSWCRLQLEDDDWMVRPPSCAPRRQGDDPISAWLRGWYIPPCGVLWSRDAFLHSGGWNQRLKVNQDGELMMRAFALGTSLQFSGDCISLYRRVPEGGQQSVSSQRNERDGLHSRASSLLEIREAIEAAGRFHECRAALSDAYWLLAKDAAPVDPAIAADFKDKASNLLPLGERLRKIGGRSSEPRSLPDPADGSVYGRAPEWGLETAARIPASSSSTLVTANATKLPRVSVIIPTYARPDELRRAMRSVLGQSMADFELLVVDDEPSAAIEALVTSFDDARIRYIPQPENMGVAAARNRGLREARAALVCFLDDDDEWLQDKLSLQLAMMDEQSCDVGMLYTGSLTYKSEDTILRDEACQQGDLYDGLLLKNILHAASSSGMVRRSVSADVGFFDTDLLAIEDHDYWTRIARKYKIACVSEPLIIHHDEQDGGTGERRSRHAERNRKARDQYFTKHKDALKRHSLAHEYLLESVDRTMRPSVRNPSAGRRLAFNAFRQKPFDRRTVSVLASLLVPDAIKRPFKPGRTS